MQNSVPAAERVRPILQAMERSISAARQQRLQGSTAEETSAFEPPQVPVESNGAVHGAAHGVTHGAPNGAPHGATSPTTDPTTNGDTPRLKARPKRATPFPGLADGNTIHSQAG